MSTSRPGATIVVPVLDEEHSVGPLLASLSNAFRGQHVEVLFVDDSRDTRTGEAVHRARARHAEHLLVKHIHRTGKARRGGLAGAVIDGIEAARSDVVLVMDGDGQHPAETAPELLNRLHAGHDVAVASRYTRGGSNDGLDGFRRRAVSLAATWLTRLMFPRGLRGITDPMTGFFAFKRGSVDIDRLRDAEGFKILFELLTRHPDTRRAEVPLQFQERIGGESKSSENGTAFIKQLLRLRVQTMPMFMNFVLGGGLIAGVGALMLWAFISAGMEPHVANAIQLATTLVLNFIYNRYITWRGVKGRRLHWQMVTFGLTRIVTQVLSWFAFIALMRVDLLTINWRAQAANVVTLLGGMALNYLTSKYLVFGKLSSRSWLVLAAVLLPLIGAGLIVFAIGIEATAIGFILVYALFGAVTSGLEVRWRLYGRRTSEAQQAMRFRRPALMAPHLRMHSIIVPALDEAAVIGNTIRRLLAQTYGSYEIIVTLAEGDDATIEAVRRCIPESGGRLRLVTKRYGKSSKPQQLNYALGYCTGDYITVVDAETMVHPKFLEYVDATIEETNADVVQGGVQLMNLDIHPPAGASFFARRWLRIRGWFAVHNVMEYFFWFSSRMFYQVDQGFVPLGGNTVVIRRSLLEKAGGWPQNLTEDCALGVKLSALYNALVVAAYEPWLVSREETPSHIFGKGGLVKQRTRWDQGFWSVLLAGEWLRLPTFRKKLMALYILAMPLIQAINGVMLPMAVVGVLTLTAPVLLVLVMFLPLMPMLMSVAVQVIGLREFGREFGIKVKTRHYLSLTLLNLPYQALLALPALIAIYRHYAGRTDWAKTRHDGAHMIAMETRTPVGAGV